MFLPFVKLTSVYALHTLRFQCSIPHPSFLDATSSIHITVFPPNMRMHTLKYVPTEHSGFCSLFIHSCGGLHVWLGTASFFSPLSPSLPFPEGLVDHKSTSLIVQYTGFIETKGTASLNHILGFLRHHQEAALPCSPLTENLCFFI